MFQLPISHRPNFRNTLLFIGIVAHMRNTKNSALEMCYFPFFLKYTTAPKRETKCVHLFKILLLYVSHFTL